MVWTYSCPQPHLLLLQHTVVPVYGITYCSSKVPLDLWLCSSTSFFIWGPPPLGSLPWLPTLTFLCLPCSFPALGTHFQDDFSSTYLTHTANMTFSICVYFWHPNNFKIHGFTGDIHFLVSVFITQSDASCAPQMLGD